MNNTPQYRQQRQQRRHSWPGLRRVGPVRGAVGRAGWGTAGAAAAAYCGGRWWYVVVGVGGWWWVLVAGGPWRPQEATEASSRTQILARVLKSSPRPTPQGPLKLRLFGQ